MAFLGYHTFGYTSEPIVFCELTDVDMSGAELTLRARGRGARGFIPETGRSNLAQLCLSTVQVCTQSPAVSWTLLDSIYFKALS